MAGERISQGRVIRGALAEDREGEAPIGHEHAAYVTEGCSQVRDEWQPLLTPHHLKTATREGQGTHIAVPPCDRDGCGWGIGTGHVKDAGIEVHADDVPKVAIPLDGHASDNSRLTRRIQHPVASLQGDMRTHQLGQGPGQRVDRLAFV
jgi:hypothetical protein